MKSKFELASIVAVLIGAVVGAFLGVAHILAPAQVNTCVQLAEDYDRSQHLLQYYNNENSRLRQTIETERALFVAHVASQRDH